MGVYAEYLKTLGDFPSIELERKAQLRRISEERGGRGILVFASAFSKPNAPTAIEYADRIPFEDQVENIEGEEVDLLLESPGGLAEVAEDLMTMLRNRFKHVAVIIPGYAKSAGTIMAMAGDEILMEPSSALGPIDAQMTRDGRSISAHAAREGLIKIKKEVEKSGSLNRAYIPILQNISTGDIQGWENALEFSQRLVTNWLISYKFKTWKKHSKSGEKVTAEERKQLASHIASELCNHGKWLSHGRSIMIPDLEEMGLRITDYSTNPDLFDAIRRYFILLKMTFDNTNIYKVYETVESNIYRHMIPQSSTPPAQQVKKAQPGGALIEFECPNCKTVTQLDAKFDPKVSSPPGAVRFPTDNIFVCPACASRVDLSGLRGQIEAQMKKRIL